MDKLSKAQRSANMSRVKGKNTGPEMLVRSVAHSLGLRFRLHRRDLPGSPDIVLPKHRLVIFVHGCFWHRHEGCRRATMPSTRKEFWEAKFAGTVARHERQRGQLEALGWRVRTVWECELKDIPTLEARLLSWTHRGGGPGNDMRPQMLTSHGRRIGLGIRQTPK